MRIVVVATIANGIDLADGVLVGAGDGEDVAPCIVLILAEGCAQIANNSDDITLLIQNIVQLGAIVDHGIGLAVLIIGKVHDRGVADGQPYQLVTHVVIGVLHAVHDLLVPQAVGIVLVGDALTSAGGGHQLPAVGPTESPPDAVVVTVGIALAILVSAMEAEASMAF